MFIMYVDESGDPGAYRRGISGNSPHFILSGLIVPVEDWNNCMERLKTFRRYLKDTYGLPVREEIHASELIRVDKILAYRKITKRRRLELLKEFVREIPNIFNQSKIINVCLDKEIHGNGRNYKADAWSRLIQRFDTFLKKNQSDFGVIVADGIEDLEVRGLLRKMRVYNPVPSKFGGAPRQMPTSNIIEDVFNRDSRHSYFIQAVDAVVHILYRREYPKSSLKKYNLDKSFLDLDSILLKAASTTDDYGIVRK